MFALFSLVAMAQASQPQNAWAISSTLQPNKQKGILRDSPMVIASKYNVHSLKTGDCVEVVCKSDFCYGNKIQEQVFMACDHQQSAQLCQDLTDEEDRMFIEHNQFARLTSMSNDVDVVYQPLSACTSQKHSFGRQLQQQLPVEEFAIDVGAVSEGGNQDFADFDLSQVAISEEAVEDITQDLGRFSFVSIDDMIANLFPDGDFDFGNLSVDIPDRRQGGGGFGGNDGDEIEIDDIVTGGQADMRVDLETLLATLYIDEIREDDDPCLAKEQCLNEGSARNGKHTVLRFSTRIYNVGSADVLLGETPQCPINRAAGEAADNKSGGLNDEFVFDACHKHWHYKDYATYTVTPLTADVPAVEGKKNGFCLLDYGCQRRGARENYGCQNQGITAGCYDEYDYTLNCQWVDITEIYNAVPRDYSDDITETYNAVPRDQSDQPNWVVLTVGVNMDQSLDESKYSNNEVSAKVNLNDRSQVGFLGGFGITEEWSCY